MMKILKIVILLLLPLSHFAQDGFVISGKVSSVKSGTAAIKDAGFDRDGLNGRGIVLPEPVRIVDGEFVLSGKLDRPRLVLLKVSTRSILVLLENTSYEISCSFDSLKGGQLKGGVLNAQFSTFGEFSSQKNGDIKAALKAAIKTEVGPYLAYYYTRDRNDVEELYPLMTEEGKNTEVGRLYKERYDGFVNSTSGKPFPKLKLTLPNGMPFTEKDMEGKVVVFDFWASWFAPCIKFIPTLRQYNERYKESDVLIVSVSVDETEDIWRKAMKDHPMEWTQVLSDGGFYNGEVKKLLSVPSVPYMVIVDKKGNIVSTLDAAQKEDLENIILKALQ